MDASDTSAAIDNIAKTVVPTKGAVVRVKYNTWIGQKAMMTLTYNGKPVPFGAVVTQTSDDSDDTRSSIVGDSGEVYLVGLAGKGRLTVKWGQSANKQCAVDYTLAGAKKEADILFINGVCHPVSGAN